MMLTARRTASDRRIGAIHSRSYIAGLAGMAMKRIWCKRRTPSSC
jgi:hypothetical protein